MAANKGLFPRPSHILYGCIFTFLIQATEQIPPDNFTHDVALLPDYVYHLFWKFDEEYITFEVHVKTHGYIGFGISINGGMVGADVIIGWLEDGKAHFHDRWSEREFEPDIDELQDWSLLSGYQTDTHTILKFKRPLVTCDKDNDLSITADTVRVIWSYNDALPLHETGLPYHGQSRRGVRSLFLLDVGNKSAKPLTDPPDAIYWDFRMDKFSLPAKDTTYLCQAFKIPELGRKHHNIRIDPIIQKGMEAHVHHMIIYECARDLNESQSHHEASWECYQDPMTSGTALDECNTVIAAWGIGGGSFEFPENVGYPYGNNDSARYIRLEIHYDNPFEVDGLVDSSGLRLWLTPNLREYDAGILVTGVTVSEQPIIPKHFEKLVVRAVCSSECLQEVLGDVQPDGINIFSAVLHTHLIGQALHVRHIRNGTELPPIAKDDYLDANFQEYRILQEVTKVLPGDDIITECTYSTTQKSKTTYGGLSAQNEMCESFMYYYPKVDLTFCESLPDTKRYEELTDGVRLEVRNPSWPYYTHIITPEENYGMPYYMIVEGTDWDQQSVRDKYQKIIGEGNTYLSCHHKGHYYNAQMMKVPMPEINEPYVKPKSECIQGTLLGGAGSVIKPGIMITWILYITSKVFD